MKVAVARWLPSAPGARLTIVPHGSLFQLSFAALIDPSGRYLIKRYSPGYPAWPELVDQRQIWKLLDPERTIGVSLTSADQMVPEQSTSAIILHHPEAVYYVVRGAPGTQGAAAAS